MAWDGDDKDSMYPVNPVTGGPLVTGLSCPVAGCCHRWVESTAHTDREVDVFGVLVVSHSEVFAESYVSHLIIEATFVSCLFFCKVHRLTSPATGQTIFYQEFKPRRAKGLDSRVRACGMLAHPRKSCCVLISLRGRGLGAGGYFFSLFAQALRT